MLLALAAYSTPPPLDQARGRPIISGKKSSAAHTAHRQRKGKRGIRGSNGRHILHHGTAKKVRYYTNKVHSDSTHGSGGESFGSQRAFGAGTVTLQAR